MKLFVKETSELLWLLRLVPPISPTNGNTLRTALFLLLISPIRAVTPAPLRPRCLSIQPEDSEQDVTNAGSMAISRHKYCPMMKDYLSIRRLQPRQPPAIPGAPLRASHF